MTETSDDVCIMSVWPTLLRAARARRAGIGAGGKRVEEEDDTEEDDRLVVLLPLWILIPPVTINGIVLLKSKCSDNGGSDELEGAEQFLKCAILTLMLTILISKLDKSTYR